MAFASEDSSSKRSSNNFFTAVCGTAKVLKEALVIISRNVKLFSAVALLVFISSTLLFLVSELAINPQASDYLTKFAEINSDISKLSQLLKRALLVMSEQLFLLAFLWILSVFSMVVNIYASAVTNYSDQKEDYYVTSLRELLVKIRKPWKRAAITWFYVTLFNIGLVALYVLVEMLITKGSGALTVLKYSLAVLYYLLDLFLGVVWILGVVISVLDQDGSCYGMKALSEAWALIKRRMIQGFLLAALFALIMLPVSAIRGWEVGIDDHESKLVPVILGVLSMGISRLLQLFSYVAYTVFYYECKKSAEGEKMDLNEKGRYSLIPLSSSS